MKVRLDLLVLDTFGWIFGARAFLDATRRAIPEAEAQERRALQTLASREHWDETDFDLARQEIDAKFVHWIPRLTGYSLIILVHLLVETQLWAMAKRLQRQHGYQLAVSEIYGRDRIERAKTYLTKVAGLPVGNDLGWEELRNLEKLRNIVVHRRGEVNDDADERREIDALREYYGPSLDLCDGGSALAVSPDLCVHFIQQVDEFFQRLFKSAGFHEQGAWSEK